MGWLLNKCYLFQIEGDVDVEIWKEMKKWRNEEMKRRCGLWRCELCAKGRADKSDARSDPTNFNCWNNRFFRKFVIDCMDRRPGQPPCPVEWRKEVEVRNEKKLFPDNDSWKIGWQETSLPKFNEDGPVQHLWRCGMEWRNSSTCSDWEKVAKAREVGTPFPLDFVVLKSSRKEIMKFYGEDRTLEALTDK